MGGSCPESLVGLLRDGAEKTEKCKRPDAYEQLAGFVSDSRQLKDIGLIVDELSNTLLSVKQKLVAVLEDSQVAIENS